jgi:hypothetical protein
MSSEDFPGEPLAGMAESAAIVQRIFVRAAERLGSAAALAHHLGLAYQELRHYLYGQAVPPEQVLLRTVDLVIEDLKALRSTCSESAWRALSLPASSPRP